MEEKRGLLLVLFSAIVSGFSIFINSYGVKGFDSSVFTFSKNCIVTIFLFAVILGLGKFSELRKLTRKNWLQLAIIGFVGGSVPFLLFFKGMQLSNSSTSGFIHKTMFVFVAILAAVFLKEKISKSLFLGATLLIIGNFLMIRPDFSLSTAHVLILSATLFWAMEYIISKNVLTELSGTIIAFGRMFFGALFILLFLTVTDKSTLIFSVNFSQVLWLIFTSALLFLFVFSFYNGLKAIKATTAASILVVGAPITSLLQLVFQNIALSISDVFGIIFICSGTVLIIWFTSFSKFIANVRQSERN